MGVMKPHTAEMDEGPQAFEGFRDAMKTIVAQKKNVVMPPEEQKPRRRNQQPARSARHLRSCACGSMPPNCCAPCE